MGYRKPNLHHKPCQRRNYCWNIALTRVFVEPPVQCQQLVVERPRLPKCAPISPGDNVPYTPNALVLFVYYKIDISESLGYPADGIRRVHFGTGSGKKSPT